MPARSRLVAALVAGTCLTGLASTATAATGGMAKGKYYCRYYDQSTMGIVTVTGARTYAYSNGKRGTYALSSRTLRFRSGPLKGVYANGRYVRKPSETYFQLFDGPSYGHAYTDATCIRSASLSH